MKMDEEINRFAENFQQAVIGEAANHDDGVLREEAFTKYFIQMLEEFEELENASACSYKRPNVAMKVSGYSFSSDEHSLDLIVATCAWETPPARIPKKDILDASKQGLGFFRKSLEGYHTKMEEATPAFDLALRIHGLRNELEKVRIIVITDGIAKVDAIPDEKLGDIEVTYHIWDMERLYRCSTSGNRREVIEIDFREFGGPIPCLSARDASNTYTSFVAIIPGETLAALYDKWGTRLLERNVRSFLQARGKVNKGIRETILDEPHMFLTYNNGISVTAERVETVRLEDGSQGILRATDFQIVNGGQTTASLYHAKRKDKADLSQVQVQMKLTAVDDQAAIDDIVPLVSRYANTQNKVSVADLASNEPFHRAVEELSRTMWAPNPTGGKQLTHWYYERARGQYADDRNRSGTAARQKVFDTLNPSDQVFDKTDLAKFENIWARMPHIVSRGAQKNFADFSERINERPLEPDQEYFRQLIAKAIIFRESEKIVRAQRFPAYRAQIVAYTIALIVERTEARIDLSDIWNRQGLPEPLANDIALLAGPVDSHLRSIGLNVTEWAKKEECWKSLRSKDTLDVSPQTRLLLLASPVQPRVAAQAPLADSDDSTTQVKAIPATEWLAMHEWARQADALSPSDRAVLYEVGERLRRRRRPIRTADAMRIRAEAISRGFRPEIRS